jgi:hypothetical protein
MQPVVPFPVSPYPTIVRGVPGVVIGVLPISVTGAIDVTGVASEMTAMSLAIPVLRKSEFMKKLEVLMRLVSPAIGANDMNVFALELANGVRQCAAVKIVRGLISVPVQFEPGGARREWGW